MDEQRIARFIKEGRGNGEGQQYKPWLYIQDVPSQGRSSRPHSHKTKREHHFLSDMECNTFFLYHWNDEVTDIREQYPLDRSTTQHIANEMGVLHPADPKTKCDIVMTTDLLITTNTGLLARSVKPSESITNRVLEKMEIEKRYWALKNVDWGIITEKELPKIRVNNIRWAYEMHSLDRLDVPYPNYWNDRCDEFMKFITRSKNISIKDVINQLDISFQFAPGEVLTLIRHLISTKKLLVDMDKNWDLNNDISFIRIPNSLNKREKIYAV